MFNEATTTEPSPQRVRDHSAFFTGIRNGLWERKHSDRMGQSVWLFGWLVGRQTNENGSSGKVLGGKAISLEKIHGETGWPVRTLRGWVTTLRATGYVTTHRSQHGLIFEIRNAKKFSRAHPQIDSDRQEPADLRAAEKRQSEAPRAAEKRHSEGGKGNASRESKEGSQRFQAFLDFAYRAYQNKFSKIPRSWNDEDYKVLREFLKANPDLTLEEFQAVFRNYLNSMKSFYREKGWRLKYACTDFDGLRDGPLHNRGGSNEERHKTTLRAGGNLSRFESVGRKAAAVDGNPR